MSDNKDSINDSSPVTIQEHDATEALGLRGAASVSNETQPFVTITHAASQEVTEVSNVRRMPFRKVGNDSVITLGNRKTTFNVTSDGFYRLNDLIKMTFQQDSVLNKYAFWNAGITLTFTAISSPLSVGHIVFQYFPVTHEYNKDLSSTDARTYFAHQYGVMDIATGKGVTLRLSPIVNYSWYSAPNTLPVEREVQLYPGYLRIVAIGLDAVFPITIQCTISFDDLKVSVPLQTDPYNLLKIDEDVIPQMEDVPVSETISSSTSGPNPQAGKIGFGATNPVAFGAGYQSIPMFHNLPHHTEDDMQFDNITDQYPVYYALPTVGSSPVNRVFKAADVLSQYFSLTESGLTAIHPISALFRSFELKAADMHVEIFAVKNNFQTCFAKVSYGYLPAGCAESNCPEMFNSKYLTHIDWNITTQNSLKFVVPYVNNARLDSTLRQFVVLNFSAVTPTMTGIAEDIKFYAIIKFKNIRMSIPKKIPGVHTNGPPPSVEDEEVVPQSSDDNADGFNLLSESDDTAPMVFTSFRQLASLRTRIYTAEGSQVVTIPRLSKIELTPTPKYDDLSPFAIALDCAVNASGTPTLWRDSVIVNGSGIYERFGYPVSVNATMIRKPFYTVHWTCNLAKAVGPKATDFFNDAMSFEQCDFANFIYPFILGN
jgi:hypothetical protein